MNCLGMKFSGTLITHNIVTPDYAHNLKHIFILEKSAPIKEVPMVEVVHLVLVYAVHVCIL